MEVDATAYLLVYSGIVRLENLTIINGTLDKEAVFLYGNTIEIDMKNIKMENIYKIDSNGVSLFWLTFG